MRRALRIIRCSDPMMWYSGLVGKLVPLLRIDADTYLSVEPDGYTNIVWRQDAEVVLDNEQSDET